jgi:hypothetical protein
MAPHVCRTWNAGRLSTIENGSLCPLESFSPVTRLTTLDGVPSVYQFSSEYHLMLCVSSPAMDVASSLLPAKTVMRVVVGCLGTVTAHVTCNARISTSIKHNTPFSIR